MPDKKPVKIRPIDVARPDPALIQEAVQIMQTGGVIVFPTTGLYGLGADATNATAIDRIFRYQAAVHVKTDPGSGSKQGAIEPMGIICTARCDRSYGSTLAGWFDTDFRGGANPPPQSDRRHRQNRGAPAGPPRSRRIG